VSGAKSHGKPKTTARKHDKALDSIRIPYILSFPQFRFQIPTRLDNSQDLGGNPSINKFVWTARRLQNRAAIKFSYASI
jgi:hypothetical protein